MDNLSILHHVDDTLAPEMLTLCANCPASAPILLFPLFFDLPLLTDLEGAVVPLAAPPAWKR